MEANKQAAIPSGNDPSTQSHSKLNTTSNLNEPITESYFYASKINKIFSNTNKNLARLDKKVDLIDKKLDHIDKNLDRLDNRIDSFNTSINQEFTSLKHSIENGFLDLESTYEKCFRKQNQIIEDIIPIFLNLH